MIIKIAGKTNKAPTKSAEATRRDAVEGGRIYEAQKYIEKTHGHKAAGMSMKEIHERVNDDKNKNKPVGDIFRTL